MIIVPNTKKMYAGSCLLHIGSGLGTQQHQAQVEA